MTGVVPASEFSALRFQVHTTKPSWGLNLSFCLYARHFTNHLACFLSDILYIYIYSGLWYILYNTHHIIYYKIIYDVFIYIYIFFSSHYTALVNLGNKWKPFFFPGKSTFHLTAGKSLQLVPFFWFIFGFAFLCILRLGFTI